VDFEGVPVDVRGAPVRLYFSGLIALRSLVGLPFDPLIDYLAGWLVFSRSPCGLWFDHVPLDGCLQVVGLTVLSWALCEQHYFSGPAFPEGSGRAGKSLFL
jgi:hypothetical protein